MDPSTASGIAGLLAHDLANDLQVLDDCVARLEEQPCGDEEIVEDLRYAYDHLERLTTRLRCLHRPELSERSPFELAERLAERLRDQLVAHACLLVPGADSALLGDAELVTDCVLEVLRAAASGGGTLRVAAASHTRETEVVLAIDGIDEPPPRLPWALLYAESVARAHGGSARWDDHSKRLTMHFPREKQP